MPDIRTPLSELEQGIAGKIGGASIPPATASKRFARNCADGYVKELSNKGRRFMAFIAHRFRRQYLLTDLELAWIDEWIKWEEPAMPKHYTRNTKSVPANEPLSTTQADLFK